MDAPGATSEGVEIQPGPVPGTMQISVAIPRPGDSEGTWLRAERRAARPGTRLTRLVAVGWDADVARATCEVENGVLRATVPRRPLEAVKNDATQA